MSVVKAKDWTKNGVLKTYKGFPQGKPTAHAETINVDLLTFINS